MKQLSLLILLALCMQACSYSQPSKKVEMKETNKNNPVYSNHDSSSVNLSEDEWKKILPEDVYYIYPGKKAPNVPLPVHLKL